MRVLKDFICENEHITERYIDNSIEEVNCGVCGEVSKRMIGCCTVILDGTNPSFPGAYEKWANIREKRHRQLNEKKRKEGI